MRQVEENSIRNVLSYGLVILTSIFFLVSCSSSIEPVPLIETRVVEVPRPAPIVPQVDQLNLREVSWMIITPENVDDVFSSLSGDNVLFAITADGYEALSLNLSDVRSMIQQQQEIILLYRNSFADR